MVVMATCLSNPSPLPNIVALVFECIKCVLCVVHSSFFSVYEYSYSTCCPCLIVIIKIPAHLEISLAR